MNSSNVKSFITGISLDKSNKINLEIIYERTEIN